MVCADSGTTLDAQARYAAGVKEVLRRTFDNEPLNPTDVIVQVCPRSLRPFAASFIVASFVASSFAAQVIVISILLASHSHHPQLWILAYRSPCQADPVSYRMAELLAWTCVSGADSARGQYFATGSASLI